jgi:hypothetical protein
LLAATVDAVTGSASPVERLADAGWAYVRFALDHPNHFRVMFSGRLSQSQPPPPLQAVMSRAYGSGDTAEVRAHLGRDERLPRWRHGPQ